MGALPLHLNTPFLYPRLPVVLFRPQDNSLLHFHTILQKTGKNANM